MLLPGHVPIHDASLPPFRNWLISAPVSAMIAAAAVCRIPGVRYRPFGFMLLGFLGALAEARLLRWRGLFQRVYRLHAGTRRLRPRASARVFRLALRCAGQGLGRRLAQANLFLLPRLHRCLLDCSALLALLCRLCRC